MDTTTIISQLEEERDRIVAAIAALNGGKTRRPGRPAKSSPGPRRKMSAAVKKRLSMIAKARWAKAKRAGKSSL